MNQLIPIKLLLKQKVSAKEIYTTFGWSHEKFRQKMIPLRPLLNGDAQRKRTYTQNEFRFLIDNIEWK